jgi:hypothetical protein
MHALGYEFRDYFFFEEDFLGGTLPPARRAWDNPMAIACFLLLTFLPDRPLLKVPFFRSCIAFSTFSDAFLPYLAITDLLESFGGPVTGCMNHARLRSPDFVPNDVAPAFGKAYWVILRLKMIAVCFGTVCPSG